MSYSDIPYRDPREPMKSLRMLPAFVRYSWGSLSNSGSFGGLLELTSK